MSTIRSRVLDLIVNRIDADVPGLGEVSKDLVGWTKLPRDKFPSVYVVAGSGGAPQEQPSSHLRTEMPVLIWGYVRSLTEEPGGVSEARETLYGQVINVLLGDALLKDLTDDTNIHGAGAIDLSLGILDTDEGAIPPFGIFRQEIVVVLHWQAGAM